MQRLEVKKGANAGTSYVLRGDEVTIGRSPSSTIRLDDNGVSRQHARLVREDGGWTIHDLGSRNAILVNGEKSSRARLAHGDKIKIGAATLEFVSGDSTILPAPAAPEAETRSEPAGEKPAATNLDSIRKVKEARQKIFDEVGKVIIGQTEVVGHMLIALLCRGHCLMVGVPGLAKTLMVRTLASVLDFDFKRIQFTPDLMPADITGTDVLEEDSQTRERVFKFIRGPIFTNILLADEINRTPPKTQAALLEAMQENKVTASGYTYDLPQPFFVLATQNPIEQEGTYPLPEAQLDRFMFQLSVEYPAKAEEIAIVKATTGARAETPSVVLGAEEVLGLQEIVRRLPVSDYIVAYAATLARASRPKDADAPPFIKDYVAWGAGPRATQCLVLAAKARAILAGRVNVSARDVRSVAAIVLRHRIFTNFQADSEGIDSDGIVARLLEAVKEPNEKDLAEAAAKP
ncbi:MAG: AAA family ATPase [Planctomycetes bacterium]|nr:AAA family ATPase [Planctomycetota bacterium]